MTLFDSEFLLRALSIVAIDLTVAGDNALVIALAVRNLPARQQVAGRIWGTLGAVVLRLVFILAVTWLLNVRFVQLVGGVVLIWIAVRLVRQPPETTPHARPATTLHEAVWLIIVADVVMSLDNVLAVAAAAHGNSLWRCSASRSRCPSSCGAVASWRGSCGDTCGSSGSVAACSGTSRAR